MIFFFQPAEESENGGKVAYEMGVFEGKWRPDEFYGLHDNPNLPAGAIGCRMGTLFAGTTEVNVDLIGKSGHAAYPQKPTIWLLRQPSSSARFKRSFPGALTRSKAV